MRSTRRGPGGVIRVSPLRCGLRSGARRAYPLPMSGAPDGETTRLRVFLADEIKRLRRLLCLAHRA